MSISDPLRDLGEVIDSLDGQTEKVAAEGTDDNRLVTVRLSGPHVDEVVLDRRAMNTNHEKLADAIRDAVNQALDDYLSKVSGGPTTDLTALRSRLDEISAEAQRSFSRNLSAMQDTFAATVAAAQEAGGRRG